MNPLPVAANDSITSPLLLGSRVDFSCAADVVAAVAAGVPRTTRLRKSSVERRAVPMLFIREVSARPGGDDGRYEHVLCCSDVREDRAYDQWLWEVGVARLLPGPYADLLADSPNVVAVDVIRHSIHHRAVVAAPQLALARHLLVESYRALDPHMTVLGGQHDWHSDWWPAV